VTAAVRRDAKQQCQNGCISLQAQTSHDCDVTKIHNCLLLSPLSKQFRSVKIHISTGLDSTTNTVLTTTPTCSRDPNSPARWISSRFCTDNWTGIFLTPGHSNQRKVGLNPIGCNKEGSKMLVQHSKLRLASESPIQQSVKMAPGALQAMSKHSSSHHSILAFTDLIE